MAVGLLTFLPLTSIRVFSSYLVQKCTRERRKAHGGASNPVPSRPISSLCIRFQVNISSKVCIVCIRRTTYFARLDARIVQRGNGGQRSRCVLRSFLPPLCQPALPASGNRTLPSSACHPRVGVRGGLVPKGRGGAKGHLYVSVNILASNRARVSLSETGLQITSRVHRMTGGNANHSTPSCVRRFRQTEPPNNLLAFMRYVAPFVLLRRPGRRPAYSLDSPFLNQFRTPWFVFLLFWLSTKDRRLCDLFSRRHSRHTVKSSSKLTQQKRKTLVCLDVRHGHRGNRKS